MKLNRKLVAVAAASMLAACGGVTPPSAEAETAKPAPLPAYEPMAPFAKFAGTAWRGEGTGPDGKPIVDVATYDMILGGRAFQSTHRLEGGTYGGRTIIFYDEGAKEYIFHYFTTAGFHTVGEIVPTDTGFTAVEQVMNHPDYAEVRSEAIFGDGTIRVNSTHVTHDGVQSDGDGLSYKQIPREGVLLFDEADALFGKRTDVKDSHDKHADND